VATLTLLGCRLVKEHLLAPDHPNLFVASFAADVFVQTLQGKGSAFVMVEQRRLPLRAVVTVGAGRDSIFRELLAVDILVALLTLGRRSGEIGRDELRFHVGRLVTIDAGGGLVRSHQWERCLRVVEARKFFPRFGGVASLATNGRSISAKRLHAFVKLSLVRVLVAGRTGEILPVIEDNRLRRVLRIRLLFVAITTGDGNMSAS